jgi:MFS family permease
MQRIHSGGWSAVIAAAIGTFMTSMDINVVNVALPVIQKTFHTSISTVQWIAIAYLLALCSTELTFGRLSDLFSLKKVYIAGFIGFTISSLFCGISPSIGVLLLFRVLAAPMWGNDDCDQ